VSAADSVLTVAADVLVGPDVVSASTGDEVSRVAATTAVLSTSICGGSRDVDRRSASDGLSRGRPWPPLDKVFTSSADFDFVDAASRPMLLHVWASNVSGLGFDSSCNRRAYRRHQTISATASRTSHTCEQ